MLLAFRTAAFDTGFSFEPGTLAGVVVAEETTKMAIAMKKETTLFINSKVFGLYNLMELKVSNNV
jgi:hypothetical protein